MITVWFFGTPSLASDVLSSLIASGDFEVRFVVSQPDKPTGRHFELTPTPVKQVALTHNIPLFQPERIKENLSFFEEIRAFDVDYFIVVAYGRIMPRALLEIPKKMCINVHGSILPKYRGASPIQSSLMAGDTVTGVTIMKMSEGMDEGDIIDILEIPIDPFETTETLFAKFSIASGPFLAETLKKLDGWALSPTPQDHANATYCTKIDKILGAVNIQDPAEKIFHLWKWLTPWPGIWLIYNGKRLLIERCDYLPEIREFETGEVVMIRGRVGVQCGTGILYLDTVKLEGKKSTDIGSFINGHPGFVGSILK